MGHSIEILYTKAADKFFRKNERVRRQYEDAVLELMFGDHPEKVDVKKIKGQGNTYYRIRIGRYRVIYAVINGKVVVVKTILAGSGGDVYKKMNGDLPEK